MSLFRSALVFLMGLGTLSGIALAAEEKAALRPNVIFILADDLGYGDLSSFGQTHFETPNVDRLAQEGMKLTNFYAGSTVCAPSRCVLMTGLHTGHCFIRGNAKLNLRPDDLTVAEVFKAAGYRTGLCGKWGLGHEGSTGVPTRQGFDSFFGYLDQHHAHNYYPAFLMRNEDRVPLRNVVPGQGDFGQGVATKKVDYSPDLIAAEALKFIERNQGRPFFLYFASTLPHANNEANRVSGAAAMEIPDYGKFAGKDWPDAQKGLAAMISRLDGDVGRILDLLKQLGLDENTLVLFSSDNGPHNEGSRAEYFDSNGPLRGTKRDLTEGGIRVPTLARWPNHIKPGTVSDHVGSFADFLPTVAELVGANPPQKTDGLSFLPTLLGDTEKQARHQTLYWEFYEGKNARAVRMGNWKGIEKPFGSDQIELYDLGNDLGETKNLAAQHPEMVAKIRQAIQQSHVPAPEWKIRAPKSSRK